MRLAIVKLGGSTAFDTRLKLWAEALAASGFPLIVVPGGGPFADQVRDAQKRIGFSDEAAHAMAILAMDQFGYALAELGKNFVTARTPDEIARALECGETPVWLPSAMTIGRAGIPCSWDVTSDSLAAWLAGELRAEALLLVKQTRDFSAEDNAGSLARRGIVDSFLPSILPRDIDFYVAGPEDASTAHRLLSTGRLPGTKIRIPSLARISG